MNDKMYLYPEKDINTYLMLEIRDVVLGIFSLQICIYRLFRNKLDDFLYKFIRNLENKHLSLFFGAQ